MQKFFPLFFIFLIVLLLYYPSFSVYFSQDDFFMFKISLTDGSIKEFINLFGFHPFEERGIAFYRPIFREALHNIYFNIFGLNHLPFRILLFSIHLFNVYLVYTLIQSIFKKRIFSFFTALFFGISSANVSTLYYLAGGIEASGATMFALISIIFYKKFIDYSNPIFQILSFLFFLLALSSHEIILATPIILAGLVLMSFLIKDSFFQLLKLWPFLLSLGLLLYVDIFVIGFSSSEQQYQFVLNFKTIFQSFTWYSLWAFGIPESLIDFVLPNLQLNPNLMRYWGDYYRVIFPTLLLSLSILSFATIFLFWKAKRIFSDKRFLFLLFWFPVSIFPIIFLPAHKSSHYLIFALPAFWGIIGYLLLNFYQNLRKSYKTLALFAIAIFFNSTFLLISTSIKFGDNNYWAATRGRLAEKLIKEIKTTYPTLPKGAVVYFKNDPTYPKLTKEWGGTSRQASFILNGNDALQLLYNDPSLQVYYEDLNDFGGNSPNDVFYIMAKID